MKRVFAIAVSLAALLAFAQPARAFTQIASCSGRNPSGCSSIFVASLNLDTVHVRLVPGLAMIGSQETQIFEVGNPANEIHYFSTWITSALQVDGPAYSGPYKLLAGHSYEVITVPMGLTTPANVTAIVEV